MRTIMGVETIITEAAMGEVMLRPLKKVSMFRATPKKAAAIMRGKSLRSIFSFGVKSQTSQNKIVEPPTRSKDKSVGVYVMWHDVFCNGKGKSING